MLDRFRLAWKIADAMAADQERFNTAWRMASELSGPEIDRLGELAKAVREANADKTPIFAFAESHRQFLQGVGVSPDVIIVLDPTQIEQFGRLVAAIDRDPRSPEAVALFKDLTRDRRAPHLEV